MLVLFINGCGQSTTQTTTSQPQTVLAKRSLKNYSKLSIDNATYAGGEVRASGKTDLPDSTKLSGYLYMAGRSKNQVAIGADADASVKNGTYSMTFVVPKRPEFARGKYELEIGCYPRDQAGEASTLIGANGEHLTGSQAKTDSALSITTLETRAPFNAHHVASAHHQMVSPRSFHPNTPQWAFAEFLHGWQRHDWRGMVDYTQLTWRHGTPNAAESLFNDFGDETLLGSKIISIRQSDEPYHVVITSRIIYALGMNIKTETMETNVLCETAPYAPSLSGKWGVVPDMRMTDQ